MWLLPPTIVEWLVDPAYPFDPARFASLDVPTLLLAGGDSPQFLRASTDALAAAIPARPTAAAELIASPLHRGLRDNPLADHDDYC